MRLHRTRPAIERFWKRIIIEPFTGCWLWTGALTAAGYGVFGKGRRGEGIWLAHRFSYLTFVGQIPDAKELDHLCHQRWCVNPYHLEAVTRFINAMRGEHPAAIQWRINNGIQSSGEQTIWQSHWPVKGQRRFKKLETL